MGASKEQAGLQEGQDLDLQAGSLLLWTSGQLWDGWVQSCLWPWSGSLMRTWQAYHRHKMPLKNPPSDFKKLIPSSLPAWPKLRPMCWGRFCHTEHTASTGHKKQKGCAPEVTLDTGWPRLRGSSTGLTVSEGGVSNLKVVKVDFSKDAYVTEHHHGSPGLPPFPRVKRSRACMLPNTQRCQMLVETGLSAFSALEKLSD